jgi:DMSO/TMAO reductase YedYZ molybdopterin-dependent catalytic subunit
MMDAENMSEQGGPIVTPLPPGEVAPSAVFASLIAVLLALLARFLLNVSTPAEIFGDRLTRFIPLPVFSQLLQVFGTSAKHIYFGGVLFVEVILTAAAGLLYYYLRMRLVPHLPRTQRFLAPDRSLDLIDIPIIAILFWLGSAVLIAPILGGGFLGADLIGGSTNVLLSQVIPNIAFAIVFVVLLRRAALVASSPNTPSSQTALSRRRLFQQIGFGALVIAGGALAWDFITSGAASLLGGSANEPPLHLGPVPSRIQPPPTPVYGAWTSVPGQTPEVTSPQDFYYVSKNLAGDPTIDAGSWSLQINGLVDTPYSLTYDQLRGLPQVQQYHTLECISNEVGGNLMSNALFIGTSLADVIQRAGIKTGASDLIFHAADGYSDSLHLSQALDPRSLIVYLIDGQPLPQPHGYPARLLIPGLYGMKNGKWLSSLEVGSGSYTGYWEERGWTDTAVVKTMTRIDVPQQSDLLVAKSMFIAGVAFAGDRGIAKVQVSTNGGQTWQYATLRRPLGNLTWVLWEYAWNPSNSGTHVIVARSIDGEGYVQPPTQEPPLPDGSSGYHAISVTVR